MPWLIRCVALAGSALALAWVLRKVPGRDLAGVLSATDWRWYALGHGLFGLAILASALRWHQMLALDRASVHLTASVRTVFMGHFFNTLLVGASSGDVAKTALYSRWFRVEASRVAAACVLDRLVASWGGLVFALLSVGTGWALGAFEAMGPVQWQVPGPLVWGGIAGLMSGLSMGVFWAMRHPESFPGRAVRTFAGSGRRLLGSRRRSGQAFGLAFGTALLFNLAQLCCLRAVNGEPIAWLHLVWVTHLITMIASLPVSVAGTGLREGASMVLLALYGIGETVAVGSALLVLSLHVTWAVAGAAAGVLEARRRHRVTWPPLAAGAGLSVVVDAMEEGEDGRGASGTLRSLERMPGVAEVVVVVSEHGTVPAGFRTGPGVRVPADWDVGRRFRAGVAATREAVVLWVPQGTWLPEDAGAAVLRCLKDPTVVGGGFWHQQRGRGVRGLAGRLRCWLRMSLARRVAWEQGVFARRELLEAGATGGWGGDVRSGLAADRRLPAAGRLALAGATVSGPRRAGAGGSGGGAGT